MSHDGYEAKPDVLVLSADSFNVTVSPAARINHVPATRIYGDGRVVFVDPAKGDAEIFQGHLDARKIAQLFELLQTRGFFGFEDLYLPKPGMVGVGARTIIAARRGKPEKHVACFSSAPTEPRTFQGCYEALLYPHIQPSNVMSYVRTPITPADLAAGWYFGFEFGKKLDTPEDWVWIDAGKSSKWARPAPAVHTVTLDSSYMMPPVDSCCHISVRYKNDPAAAGSTIQFDRNGMGVNEFGDIGIHTMMYFEPRPATCTLIDSRGDERLFSIAVPDYTGAKLRLVVFGDPARPVGGRLLELDDHDAIRSIHWLQASPS